MTLFFFFVLIGLSFMADRYKASQDAKNNVKNEAEVAHIYVEFKPFEIYKELVAEKAGNASLEKSDIDRRDRMKTILKEYQ